MRRLLVLLAAGGTVALLPTIAPSQARSRSSSRLAVKEGDAATIDSGARIWDAGRLLSKLLLERDLSGKRVLELGSGTGIGGLSAAAAGAETVVLTDGEPSMIPLLEANIAANGFHRREGVVSRTLSWGDDDHIEAVAALGPYDLVVGSDLLYNPASTMLLVDTLEALSTPGRTEVLLTYPTRFTEGIFLDEALTRFDEVGWTEELEDAMFASRLTLSE